ncbi:MAG: hypothetical protein A2Y33_05840 [Spirochaetes bacterium GWF1_51_8]|nr:MAG: hypothetical protein A2Y33_05840 [Spirochaetes bacterium GWF1_51_8]
MRKLIVFWSGILLAVIVFFNSNCSGNIFGETDIQKIITNWETAYEITYCNKTNATTNYNFTINVTNSRVSNFSWIFKFKPYGQYEWITFKTNVTNDSETGTYIINQFSDKITLYSSTTLQVKYLISSGGGLTLKDFMILSNGTNYAVHPVFTTNIGADYFSYYDTEFVFSKIAD